jgi:hypothetical protein
MDSSPVSYIGATGNEAWTIFPMNVMKHLVLIIFISLIFNIKVQAQLPYQILLEGEYPVDGDTTLYKNLDWFGFYKKDDSFGLQQDSFEKIQLKIEYQKNYHGSDLKTKPSIISTSNPDKSLFLLGVDRGKQLGFKSKHRCGSNDKYSFQETSLFPGRWVDSGFPSMSCTHLAIFSLGSVEKSGGSYEVKNYRIMLKLSSYDPKEEKTQEITGDIIEDGERIWADGGLLVPYVFATGDFDLDARTDFILWYHSTFYLYLTRYATGNDIVKLVAKSKLKKKIDFGYNGPPE